MYHLGVIFNGILVHSTLSNGSVRHTGHLIALAHAALPGAVQGLT